jgi:hypothetical protein
MPDGPYKPLGQGLATGGQAKELPFKISKTLSPDDNDVCDQDPLETMAGATVRWTPSRPAFNTPEALCSSLAEMADKPCR